MSKEIWSLENFKLDKIFTPEKGWSIVYIPASQVDQRATRPGDRLRCIDRSFGTTPTGYDPESIPLGPAWLGAIDGFAAFYRSRHDALRLLKAYQVIEEMGFQPADHANYLIGEDGCGFRAALQNEKLSSLVPITKAQDRVLKAKLGVHRDWLYTSPNPALGFLVNDLDKTTVLPDAGHYYPIDFWAAVRGQINPGAALQTIEKCGQLLLPSAHRTLFIVQNPSSL